MNTRHTHTFEPKRTKNGQKNSSANNYMPFEMCCLADKQPVNWPLKDFYAIRREWKVPACIRQNCVPANTQINRTIDFIFEKYSHEEGAKVAIVMPIINSKFLFTIKYIAPNVCVRYDVCGAPMCILLNVCQLFSHQTGKINSTCDPRAHTVRFLKRI